MGGAKKKGLAKVDKSQKSVKEKKPSGKKAKPTTEKRATAGLPKIEDPSLIQDLAKMKAITPASIASTYSVRVSDAKNFLGELEKRKLINFVEGCRRLRIYKSSAG